VALYALGDVEPRIHADAYIHPDATVIGNVTIGADSTVWPHTVLRGDYGYISDCVIGHLAHLECCTVHDGSLVGTGSIVLHRAVVESGALVGAGAVVPNDMVVPSRAMALGVPAKLRPDSVDDDEIKRIVALYVDNAKRYRAELRRLD
jgi:carbonic anhydrase/acetyltransferase-like protein (isoleucine patch superfamily)